MNLIGRSEHEHLAGASGFDMRMGWLRGLHDKKKFVAVKVATENNLADDLTKPLDSKTRKRLDEEVEIIKKQILGSFRGHVTSDEPSLDE